MTPYLSSGEKRELPVPYHKVFLVAFTLSNFFSTQCPDDWAQGGVCDPRAAEDVERTADGKVKFAPGQATAAGLWWSGAAGGGEPMPP